MSFGLPGHELVDAAPVTDGTETCATPAAGFNKHVPLAGGNTSTSAKNAGGVRGAGGHPGSKAQLSATPLEVSDSAVAGTCVWRDTDAKLGSIDTLAGALVATTINEVGGSHLAAVRNGERGLEGSDANRSFYADFPATAKGVGAAKVRQRSATVTTLQAAPTSSPHSTSSPHLQKMVASSQGLKQALQPRPPLVSIGGGPLSHTLSSTAVPVRHLYFVPSAFYAHNSVTSSAVLSAARLHRGHNGTSTGLTPLGVVTKGISQPQVRLQPEVSRSPSGMDVLAERARRAAQLYASGGIDHEAEAALPGTAGSRLGPMERPELAVRSSSSSWPAVQVARGYGVPRDPFRQGLQERALSDYGEVDLVPGSKRHRHRLPSHCTGSSEHGRREQRLTSTSDHGGGGVVVSARWMKSPSASSSSSMLFASPQSPVMALVSATASASSVVATRALVPPSPFSTLLAAFHPASSGATAPSTGTSVPLSRAFTGPCTQLPSWVRPWLSHAFSRAMAAHLERDADAATSAPVADLATSTAGGSGGTATQVLGPFRTAPFSSSATVTVASTLVPPCTLKTALLLVFDGLEQLEADLEEVLLGVPDVNQLTCDAHRAAVDDSCGLPRKGRRASCALTPCSATSASAASPSDRLVEQLRRLTRQWCEVVSQWPCEAAMFGYVEWWLGHPSWSDLITCTAASSVPPSGFVTADRKETGNGDEQLPQERALVLQGILAASVTEGMHMVLDALVDAFVRAVSDLLRGLGVVGQPRRTAHTAPRHNAPEAVTFAAAAKSLQTCQELIRLLGSLYLSPPPVLYQLLTLMRGGLSCTTTVVGAASKGNERTATRHADEGSSAAPCALSTDTAGAVVSDDPQRQRARPRPRPLSSTLSPRGGSPGSPSSPQVGYSPGNTSQLRSRVCQLHYQLLYAVCRLCNELPMLWGPQNDTQDDAVEGEETNGVRASVASHYASLSLRPSGHYGEREMEEMSLFASAVQLAATVSALLLHVQLPMKGDLLCLTGRLVQWRAALLRSSCMGEREYMAAMSQLRALMAQAT
ncbi:hypothetical protein JKF63_06321 [Porcisia hertigi]|uniref:Uncharacterized protein n=1 Tax=Porcisia hertigi TaxID=2761500 RepID=A0A836LEU1_9TRYP|nr:hypothetical protein JKF63_06321 [Porcisia hertigi]